MAGLLLAHQALGQRAEAEAVLQTLREYVAPLGDPAMEYLVVSAETRLAVLEGRSGTARRWLEATEPPPEGALFWWLEIPSITRCRAMMAVGSPDGPVQAEAQLRERVEVIEAQHNTCQLIRVLALLALACAKQAKAEESLTILERAVVMARTGQFFLPFVELGTPMVDLLDQLHRERRFTAQVERLVAAFGAPADRSDPPGAGAGEPHRREATPSGPSREAPSPQNRMAPSCSRAMINAMTRTLRIAPRVSCPHVLFLVSLKQQ
jgi:LuxR family maltose regulon positive regulatory protein